MIDEETAEDKPQSCEMDGQKTSASNVTIQR